MKLALAVACPRGGAGLPQYLKRGFGFESTAQTKENDMLQMAAVFFVIALIAAVFGFGGIAAGAVEIAKILFFVFLIMFIVTLVMGIMRG
jgi:uncharacterized membrane protein YtjA (UPF0391 family)